MKKKKTEYTIYFAPHELAKVRHVPIRVIFDEIRCGKWEVIQTVEGLRIPVTYSL